MLLLLVSYMMMGDVYGHVHLLSFSYSTKQNKKNNLRSSSNFLHKHFVYIITLDWTELLTY